jgi:uncharacterized DUF497 family protein
MEFEFDPAKSEANREKHGIDFVEAQVLWNVWGYEKNLPFATERRWMRVAPMYDRFWTVIYTLRDKRVRLISVRRARKEELEDYDTEKGDDGIR